MITPCRTVFLSLTGDFQLYYGTIDYIIQHHFRFPSLKEIHFHCTPPPTYTTLFSFCNAPASLQPPPHIPAEPRIVAIFLTIPAVGPGGQVKGRRYFRVDWDLRDPRESTVFAGNPTHSTSVAP